MPKRIKNKPISKWKTSNPPAKVGYLRIVGGDLRGRQVAYSGDPRTRPMKDNIREALFNLVGANVSGKHAFDLFAGSGAIGFEAISRGAERATLIERHIPSARLIESSSESLGLQDRVSVLSSDTFFWFRQFEKDASQRPEIPWIVFCSPPYAFFLDRADEMMQIVQGVIRIAPVESIIVCESDSRFRLRSLPDYENWRTRHYSPAVISTYRIKAGHST